ncbi:hypothetical protein AKJ65_08060 [candidate division MSBL1 archaeon SCGC-AAA259E19]|uniref:CARDB domain-containing protein n=1 Tax=candidate division MSBL1 archaeon SCGC-AAA259E19 TaxID=1698264 RepID=A0A133UD16_9EURY|nr:hypothetical protein AKJ65_08060 [candidate division MSBL1 archaeon SCGC-AAA259E19]
MLSDQLFGMEPGTEEYISTVKEIQSIIVPQVPAVFTGSKSSRVAHVMDRWINKPNKDDPYEHRQDSTAPCFSLKHAYPKNVRTTGFSISPGQVEVGEAATATATLKNDADCDLRYAVYLRNGEAEPGPGPEVLTHTAVTVPADETVDVELEVSFDAPGSYKITVDDWRIDKWDVGAPRSRNLIVTSETNREIPGGLESKVITAITTADEAKNAAQAAETSANNAREAAESAHSAAEEARTAVEEVEVEGGASTTMVIVSMVITIIVVLGGVYAITSKQG